MPPGALRGRLDERGMLYFVFNPAVVCVLVAHDIGAGEWVCQIPYFPPYQSPSDFPAPVRNLDMMSRAWGLPDLSRCPQRYTTTHTPFPFFSPQGGGAGGGYLVHIHASWMLTGSMP